MLGFRSGPEGEVGLEEWREPGVVAEVVGRVRAEQADQGLGDDPGRHRAEREAIRRDLGPGQDVVPERVLVANGA